MHSGLAHLPLKQHIVRVAIAGRLEACKHGELVALTAAVLILGIGLSCHLEQCASRDKWNEDERVGQAIDKLLTPIGPWLDALGVEVNAYAHPLRLELPPTQGIVHLAHEPCIREDAVREKDVIPAGGADNGSRG